MTSRFGRQMRRVLEPDAVNEIQRSNAMAIKRPRMAPPVHRSAGVLAALLAFLLLWTTVDLIRSLGPHDWGGWYVIAPLAAAGAIGGSVVWFRRQWLYAAPAFLLAAAGPWGIFWPAPAFFLILAIASIVAFARDRRARPRQSV